MKTVDLYTDGACSGNPGIGGWGAILVCSGHEKILSDYEPNTTNNRMELIAVIEGLRALNQSSIVNLYSDSAYVINAINQDWLTKWQKNQWRTSSKDDVKNIDLWQKFLNEYSKHQLTAIKVKGHSDNVYNNRCDELARMEIVKHR